jgi:group I intron endonuclease
MNTGIYKITNIKNGKIYIGSSSDMDRRKYEHFNDLANNIHVNKHLQNAYNLDGKDNFIFSIIELCNKNDLLIREQSYLDTLTPFRENGYNIGTSASGGDNYSNLSDMDKERFVSKSRRVGKNNGMYEKNHTDTAIKIMREKSIGRYTLGWFVEKYGKNKGKIEYTKRRNQRTIAVSGENNPFYGKNIKSGRFMGKKHSDETKRKMATNKTRIKDDILFMEKIKDKSISLLYIAIEFNVSPQTISYHCKKLTGHAPSHFRK